MARLPELLGSNVLLMMSEADGMTRSPELLQLVRHADDVGGRWR
jgi:hypothetical protein